jgi:hypothetical protein
MYRTAPDIQFYFFLHLFSVTVPPLYQFVVAVRQILLVGMEIKHALIYARCTRCSCTIPDLNIQPILYRK